MAKSMIPTLTCASFPMGDVAFPVIYSVLAGHALIAQVLSRYKIEPVSKCIFWHRGLSDVYLVETETTKYILRVSHVHWRTQSDIDFELALLDFLHQKYIPVAYPLRTLDGQLAIEIDAPEGKRYASLFVYAPGQVAIGDLNIEQGRILGETIAKLHHHSLEFRCDIKRQPLTLNYLLDDSLATISPFLQHRGDDLAYLTETINQIKLQLQHFPQESPFWVVCWGDPHSGNVHFTEDNQPMLFDFDQCGYGWRIFEIAKFWQVSIHSGLSSKVRDAFVQGYQSVTPLLPEEMAALQPFTIAAHCWVWAIFIHHATIYDYSRLDDRYFQNRLEHLKLLRTPEWQLF